MPPWLPPVLVSPFVGSFVGVLIRRLPAGRPVGMARSACESCGAALTRRDLVPLASFVWLRGRCRHCGAPISWTHPATELAAIGVAAWAATAEADAAALWCDCALGWALLALGWIDETHMILPDLLTLPLILVGLAATAWLEPWSATDHAAATALGYLSLRAVAWGYRRLRGRDGLGEGDAKLLAAAGAWVGLGGLPLALAGGALIALGSAALRGGMLTRQTAVPFGSSLALAVWLVRLFGGQG